ncbi:THAP domain-containing 6-like isoform X1 [Labeo rohita]|uniref:THAP domain-containing 6-like isoform X1 n=1 Tax=Labeo rohita TaxID=84645 RepID=A0A498NQM8_LABRO|nr:THAP domain-containing 6-like isoform X1 [Labeo rohita]
MASCAGKDKEERGGAVKERLRVNSTGFPKSRERRRKWEVTLRRDGFAATDRTLICSEHFRTEDFDRTGQTVRIKDGVVPSIFSFPAHLQRAIKAKFEQASVRLRKLQREKSNALRREKRAKNNMQALLEELKEKNLINEELKDRLECYSDLPVHLLSRQGVEYTKAQRDFALTLHLHGPKAYNYLRETLHIHLPHPSSMQRWLSSLDARPGLNKMMLDMLDRRRQEDEDKYGRVTLMLDAMSIKHHVQHDPQTQTMFGYVDMGDRLNETAMASEVLVFMVVGLQVLMCPLFLLINSIKVSLAAQTLSNSVAVAFSTMQEVGYAEFKDCEATTEFIKMPVSKWYLSVLGFIINIDTLISMVPVLLEGQRYVLTYRFSQDHLELLFNSIRASGGWNNNPNASQFKYIFRKLMARCGVVKPCRGNVTAQDETETLPAVIDTSTSLSAVDMSSAAGGEEDLPSPFADIPALVHDHSYLPLVDNALVYISGFVVRRALKKLSCDVCRASLVTDAASAIKDQSYHLLSLKNNGGLVIPSEGTVRVVRAAEWVIRQASASFKRSQPIKQLEVMYIVRKRIG